MRFYVDFWYFCSHCIPEFEKVYRTRDSKWHLQIGNILIFYNFEVLKMNEIIYHKEGIYLIPNLYLPKNMKNLLENMVA